MLFVLDDSNLDYFFLLFLRVPAITSSLPRIHIIASSNPRHHLVSTNYHITRSDNFRTACIICLLKCYFAMSALLCAVLRSQENHEFSVEV